MSSPTAPPRARISPHSVFLRDVEARCYKKDRYGRETCHVYEGLRDFGLEQLRAGMAWHLKQDHSERSTQERLVYRGEEEAAKAVKRGLWKDATPVPPWEWRKLTGKASGSG